LNCGGKGFAAVLHTSGNRPGVSGPSLGYGGLSNVFAIEFDTSTDPGLNDPANGAAERHISVIVDPGFYASGNEA